MAEDSINCIVLKINGDELLMPNSSVAEIVPIRNIINVANKPDWMLGYLDWRGISVPLVSFESLGGVRMPSLASGNVKAAVMFSTSEDRSFPFIAILVQDTETPTMMKVRESDLITSKEPIAHPSISDRVMMAEGTYSVMDLEKLETIIRDTMT